MKTHKTGVGRSKAALAALGVLIGLAGTARAGTSDALTVTITPTAAYSVTVTTTNVVLNLGSVGLNTSTQTVRPSTITVTSSYAQTNLQMQGIMAGAGTPWTFASNTASLGNNQLATWAVFTDTSVTVAPAQGANYFVGTVPGAAGSDVVDTTQRNIGGVAGTGLFITGTTGSAGYKQMTNLPPNTVDLPASRAHLWTYFTLPPTTTDNNAKLVTFVITAGP